MPKSSPSLLLLPPPPLPLTREFLSAAYRSPITAVVSKLKELPVSSTLYLILPCPTLHGQLRMPRSQIYDEAQRLVAGIYSLVCIVCAKLQVDVESDAPGSVDARVILLDYSDSRQNAIDSEQTTNLLAAGPIIDLPTLSLTQHQWNLIFSVDGESGQGILADYLQLANKCSPPPAGHVEVVGGGVSLIQKPSSTDRAPTMSASSHYVVAVGGTFDHLHAGHKLLLTATALLLQPTNNTSPTSRRLIVGITGDELLKNKKYAEYLRSWIKRQEDVVDFLLSILSFTRSSREEAVQTFHYDVPGPNGHAIHTKLKACSITIECVEIQDPFGPTVTDESITALVVSGETRSGGQAVNDRRAENGWKALEVFEVNVLDARESEPSTSIAEDFASKISSTEIRRRKAEKARISSL